MRMSIHYEGDSTTKNVPGLFGTNTHGGDGTFGIATEGGRGVVGVSDSHTGVEGNSSSGVGVWGSTGKDRQGGTVPSAAPAVHGETTGTGAGVEGYSYRGVGVWGSTGKDSQGGTVPSAAPAVHGETTGTGAGVEGISASGAGVWGSSTGGGRGVVGISVDNTGVEGDSTSGVGVWGSTGKDMRGALVDTAVEGVHGETAGSGAGVVGLCTRPFTTNDGVLGICQPSAGNAIHGIGGENAGLFEGRVVVQGEINATAISALSKSFRIDHPCDPTRKYLQHSSIESAEMLNIYSGNVRTDGDGNADIVLPDYFEALNTDFRYHLTVIGQFARAIIASEIENNRFDIKTDKPHVKVSWQVTGVRQDPYAKANPLIVEREKPAAEQGLLLHPEVHRQMQVRSRASRTSHAAAAPIRAA
jgi:trimeric autotransporter adhesin